MHTEKVITVKVYTFVTSFAAESVCAVLGHSWITFSKSFHGAVPCFPLAEGLGWSTCKQSWNPQPHCDAQVSIGKQPWNRQEFWMRKGRQPEGVQGEGRKGVSKCNFASKGPKTKRALHQMPVRVLLLFACCPCWLYWCCWRCAPHCQSWCFPSWKSNLPATGHGSQTAVHFKQTLQEEVSSSRCCSPSSAQNWKASANHYADSARPLISAGYTSPQRLFESSCDSLVRKTDTSSDASHHSYQYQTVLK